MVSHLNFISTYIIYAIIIIPKVLPLKYNFDDFDPKAKYTPMEYNTSLYNSSSPCVTFADLIAYHYTDRPATMDTQTNVFPENFCYSILTYNITREDFSNIIEKNLNAFKNYRKLIAFYIFSNYSYNNIMEDGCAGYLTNIACYYEFPACIDNGDNTFSVHPTCSSACTKYKRRCKKYTFKNFCVRNISAKYCPGKVMTNQFIQVNFIFILFIFFAVLL